MSLFDNDPLIVNTEVLFMQECFVPSCVEIVLMELMHFNYFAIIYPQKKVMNLHVKKLEIPVPKNAVCQVWLKI